MMTPTDWLATPLGRRCLEHEQELMGEALERVFGIHMLQIGQWGPRDAFLSYARTQRQSLVTWERGSRRADIVSRIDDLAIADDSIDAVILPHTLELTDSPQVLLRETNRVLRDDGHLVVLAFDPASPWGLRSLALRDGYPPGHRMLREGRLRDWLELLSFEVAPPQRYCHTLPFEHVTRFATVPREHWARRWLPLLAGAYMITAQKRVHTLTPLRPEWQRSRLRAVRGLVEPTPRASASSRVRDCA